MDNTSREVSGVGVIITKITTLVFNAMVIIAYIKMKKQTKNKAANIFLLNQACADLSSILPSMLWSLFAFTTDFHHLDKEYKIFFLFTSFVIIGSILVTTLDRFFHVKSPTLHHKVGGKFQVVVSILVAWILPIIPTVAYTAFVPRNNIVDEFKFARVVFSILLILVCVIVGLLFMTYQILRASVNQRITEIVASPISDHKEDNIMKEHSKERRLILILFCMAMAYAATILPHIIVVLVTLHYRQLELHYSIVFWQRITYMVYTLSATVDPLLTIFLRSDFKRAKYWLLLRKCFPKKRGSGGCDDNEATMLSTSNM